MSSKKQDVAIVGAGAAACAVCCAGPIIGFLAAVGLGTVLGVALFGLIGMAIAAIGTIILVRRRRRRSISCGAGNDVSVEMMQRH